jgi:MarR family transcriptional regulator, organic hydroperoxide resistance regulator
MQYVEPTTAATATAAKLLTEGGNSTRRRVAFARDEVVKATLDLDNYLPYLVNRVGNIIAEQFGAEALAPYRLSIAMWRVMAVLASRGGQRQIDLADLTSIDVSTLSRLVTRLVAMGVVSRTRSANSTREVVVKLTAKGKAQVARLVPIARDYEAVAITGVRPEELAILKNSLRRVYANMKNRQRTMSAPRRLPKGNRARGVPAAAAE